MRTLFLLLLSLGSLLASAQPIDTLKPVAVDSSTIVVTDLSLTEEQHLLIFDCLEDIKSPLALGYGAQIAKGLTKGPDGKPVYEPAKRIPTNVTEGFIHEVYVLMGVQQERFAAGINDVIAQDLFRQLTEKGHTHILRVLDGTARYNQGLKAQKVARGFKSVSAFVL